MLVYNIRPQAMERLGLGYETLNKVNPRLIYVGAYGYSQHGSYADKPAFDNLISSSVRNVACCCYRSRQRPSLYSGRGRDTGFPMPPAQIRTCRITAYGSYLGCNA